MPVDELAARRLRDAVRVIRNSFARARERGDSAFYLRPDTATLLLDAATRVADVERECLDGRCVVWALLKRLGGEITLKPCELVVAKGGSLCQTGQPDGGLKLVALAEDGTETKDDPR